MKQTFHSLFLVASLLGFSAVTLCAGEDVVIDQGVQELDYQLEVAWSDLKQEWQGMLAKSPQLMQAWKDFIAVVRVLEGADYQDVALSQEVVLRLFALECLTAEDLQELIDDIKSATAMVKALASDDCQQLIAELEYQQKLLVSLNKQGRRTVLEYLKRLPRSVLYVSAYTIH